jgi:hypothetical protein
VTEGIPVDLPALLLSTKLQRMARSVGLPDPGGAEGALEIGALLAALAAQEVDPRDGAADAALVDGDVETAQRVGAALFELADLSRRSGVDPEQALRAHALAFRDTIVASEKAAPGLHMPDGPTN